MVLMQGFKLSMVTVCCHVDAILRPWPICFAVTDRLKSEQERAADEPPTELDFVTAEVGAAFSEDKTELCKWRLIREARPGAFTASEAISKLDP